MMMKYPLIFALLLFLNLSQVDAQTSVIHGKINATEHPLRPMVVTLENTPYTSISDSLGYFEFNNLSSGSYDLTLQNPLYENFNKEVILKDNDTIKVDINLVAIPKSNDVEDVVISGTMKAIQRTKSPVPVEVYTPTFLRKNPTPSIFDALQNINGVRPQLNCNICNTGDIHINGLEGPYTMVLIDGMPIVSSLGTVYGLSGIPNSIIERIEVVKGPASSLYGSEAVGGLINIITKKAQNAPLLSADIMSTSWLEHNIDLAAKFNPSKKISVLTGLNYFNYQNITDNNNDNFTDVTLQNRISIFQKWNFERKNSRLFTLAARYLYEDRWGGDVRWNKTYRGGDQIYGESIYTNRTELFGNYQLPLNEKILLGFSFINHAQDSRYGTTSYIADQKIAFGQLTWDKKLGQHDILAGAALRYTFYDDNTPGTANSLTQNAPEKTWLPGLFIQDEIAFTDKHTLLLGIRYDYNSIHGSILTPRMAYKWTLNDDSVLRLNAGTGFRVVNLFTEDHAALTGARDVIIKDDLKPEKSYNLNINYLKKFYFESGSQLGLDATLFYTHFNNRIVPDYESNSNQIIYSNLDGYAVSKGLSLNADLNLRNGLKVNLGATLMENTIVDQGIKQQQMLTEKLTGTWSVSYKIKPLNLTLDYTGNLYSPMRLPLLGALDPRPGKSPWWSIQNIQITYDGFKKFELYGGVKNLFNWTPNKSTPFLIARSHDPFDQQVSYNSSGSVIPTANNPYALTFDPSYVYAPNQGIRVFLGLRFKID